MGGGEVGLPSEKFDTFCWRHGGHPGCIRMRQTNRMIEEKWIAV